jgi:AcrR family transcriptional regulator
MGEVARRSGVSDRTLYRYFPSRQDLFDALPQWLNDLVEREFDASSTTTPAELAGTLAPAFRELDRRRDVYRLLDLLPDAHDRQYALHEVRKKNVTRAVRPATTALTSAEARKVTGVVHLLTSSKALYFLEEHWGLTADEAAELLGWTIGVVTRHAGERRGKR